MSKYRKRLPANTETNRQLDRFNSTVRRYDSLFNQWLRGEDEPSEETPQKQPPKPSPKRSDQYPCG